MKKAFAVLATTAILSACGGGGSDSSTPPPAASEAQGLWNGSTPTNRAVTALVLSDGTYYVLYSRVGNSSSIGGVVQGTSTATGGAFSSSNAVDFNLEGLGVLPGTVSGNYTTKQSLSGAISRTKPGNRRVLTPAASARSQNSPPGEEAMKTS